MYSFGIQILKVDVFTHLLFTVIHFLDTEQDAHKYLNTETFANDINLRSLVPIDEAQDTSTSDNYLKPHGSTNQLHRYQAATNSYSSKISERKNESKTYTPLLLPPEENRQNLCT
jgi:hypothetical protein